MIYFTSFVVVFIMLIIYVYVGKKKGKKYLFNNPLIISSYFFILIHIVLPPLQWYEGFFRYSTYSYDIYLYSILYTCLLFIVYCFIFVLNPSNISYEYRKFQIERKSENRYLRFIWFFCTIGIMCSGFYLFKILSVGLDVFLSDRIGFNQGGSLVVMLSHWVYISCILFFSGYLVVIHSKRKFLISFIFSFIYCLIYYGVNSNRNSIFILVLVLLVLFFSLSDYKLVKKFKISYIFIFTLAFGGLFNYIGYFRNKIKDYVVEDSSYSSIFNGGFGNHENIVWLLENNFNLLLGKTYLVSFLNIIPRSIWSNKPYGAGPELKNMIEPGSYVLGQSGNSSLTTGLFTEALMNYGVLGSIVFIFLFSIAIYVLLAFFKRNNSFFSQIAFIYLFVLLSSQLFYAEFLGFYARTLITCIPIFIISFFVKFKVRK